MAYMMPTHAGQTHTLNFNKFCMLFVYLAAYSIRVLSKNFAWGRSVDT